MTSANIKDEPMDVKPNIDELNKLIMSSNVYADGTDNGGLLMMAVVADAGGTTTSSLSASSSRSSSFQFDGTPSNRPAASSSTRFFIRAVQQREILYNHNTMNFKNLKLKDMIWKRIVQECQLENIYVAKRKFATLREKYVKEKKRQNPLNWEFFDDMRFLDPFINLRKFNYRYNYLEDNKTNHTRNAGINNVNNQASAIKDRKVYTMPPQSRVPTQQQRLPIVAAAKPTITIEKLNKPTANEIWHHAAATPITAPCTTSPKITAENANLAQANIAPLTELTILDNQAVRYNEVLEKLADYRNIESPQECQFVEFLAYTGHLLEKVPKKEMNTLQWDILKLIFNKIKDS